jgi:NAD(P)-dependent dehydrogenase (short-subunit alcohol dehydrogenase family)
MSAIDASTLLRQGLLEHVSILLARAAPTAADSVGADLGAAFAGLGARVSPCELFAELGAESQQDATERAAADAATQALAEAGVIGLLAVDAASVFSRAYGDSRAGDQRDGVGDGDDDRARDALAACLDASWNVSRVIAERAFLPDSRGGRIVYIAPRSDAGEHADAACAGLENLARTLSIEWARHGTTVVAIAPGAKSSAGEVAALTAYLASPAGAYFSGCLLDLRGPAAGR